MRVTLARICVLLGMIGACWLPVDVSAQGTKPKPAGTGKSQRDLPLFQRQHAATRQKFAVSLEELAQSCEQKGLEREAEFIRQWAVPLDHEEVRFHPLPREVQPPLPATVSADERYWRTQLKARQQDYAKELYLISRRVLSAGYVTYAYDLVRELAVHDPDHTAMRKILGYVRNGNEWVSPFESNMIKARKVWHAEFGWIPKEHVERYERGERYYDRRWISAAKEAEIRRDFNRAWEIRTEHYLVRTNHSLEKGVELATRLEQFHDVFFQLLAGFFNTPEQAQLLFEGNGSRSVALTPPHEVHYYRTRDEYIAVLKTMSNQAVEITKGMYFPDQRIAYFFDDPDDNDETTLYHEATHQLLSGARPQAVQIGIKAHFWLVEGIACYMESFHKVGDRFSVGDPRQNRLQAARANFLQQKYYLPLRDLTRMGMAQYQTDKNIRMNYSQSTALTHFFMHYENGKYREALIEHLSQIYSPRAAIRDNPQSLAELTGVEFEDLDRQYTAYISRLVPAPQRPAEP